MPNPCIRIVLMLISSTYYDTNWLGPKLVEDAYNKKGDIVMVEKFDGNLALLKKVIKDRFAQYQGKRTITNETIFFDLILVPSHGANNNPGVMIFSDGSEVQFVTILKSCLELGIYRINIVTCHCGLILMSPSANIAYAKVVYIYV